MFKITVLACREVKGVSSTGRAYQFFSLNCVVTGPDGQAVAGNIVVDKAVSPGQYQASAKLDSYKGKVSVDFSAFTPAQAAVR